VKTIKALIGIIKINMNLEIMNSGKKNNFLSAP